MSVMESKCSKAIRRLKLFIETSRCIVVTFTTLTALTALAAMALFIPCLVSCDFNGALFSGTTGNPFVENSYDFPLDGSEDPSFVIVSDVHLGREGNDHGTKRYDSKFLSFLKNGAGRWSAMLSLGDFIDEDNVGQQAECGFLDSFVPYCSNRFIGVVGNHETHVSSMEAWEDSLHSSGGIDVFMKRMAVYRFGDVSIYVLDNAKRTFGYMQLDYLEEALERDDSAVKIVLAHENVFTGRKLDQSLVVFGNFSATETARFSRILRDNDVSLVLTGHTHNGGVVYSYGDGCHEMNLASYHGYDGLMDMEGNGSWYVLSIDRASREIVVTTYDAPTAKAVAKDRFGY